MAIDDARYVCPNCGMPIEHDARFCSHCGQQVVKPAAVDSKPTSYCPQCGAEVEEGSKFCGSCGASLVVGPAVADGTETGGGAEAAAGFDPVVSELDETALLGFEAPEPELGDEWFTSPAAEAGWAYDDAYDPYSTQDVRPSEEHEQRTRKSPVVYGVVAALCIVAIAALVYFVPRLQNGGATDPAADVAVEEVEEGTAEGDSEATEAEDVKDDDEDTDAAEEQAEESDKKDEESSTKDEASDKKDDAQPEATPSEPAQETKGAEKQEAPAAAPATPAPTNEEEGAYPPNFPWVDASSEQSAAGYASSSYSPSMARDKNPSTAWLEAAYGPGVGEWIRVSADTPQRVSGVSIMGGFPKSGDIYYANYRPQQIRIELSDGYVQQATLADSYGAYQEIRFDHTHPATWVRIIIDSVYDTNHWTDTAIAEIDVF